MYQNGEGECEVLNPGGVSPAETDPHVRRLRHEVLMRQARGLLDRQKAQQTQKPPAADGFNQSDFVSKADAWLARERDKNREGAERHTGLTPRNSPGSKTHKRRHRSRRSKSITGTSPKKSKKRRRSQSYAYGEMEQSMPSTDVMRGLLRQQRQARAVQPVPQAVPHPSGCQQQGQRVPGHHIPGIHHPIPIGAAEEERLVKGEGGLDYVERGLGAQVNKLEEKGAAEAIGWQSLLYVWFLMSAGVMAIARHHLNSECGNLRRFCLIFLFSALLSLFILVWVVLLRVHVERMKKLSCFPLLIANLLGMGVFIALAAGELFDPTCGDAWALNYITAYWALFVFVMPLIPVAIKAITRERLYWWDVFMLQVMYITHSLDVFVRGNASDLTPFLVGSTILAVIAMVATVHPAAAILISAAGIALSMYSANAAFDVTGSHGTEAKILLVTFLSTSALILGHTVWRVIRRRGTTTPPVPPPMALDQEKPALATARSNASQFSDIWFSKMPNHPNGQAPTHLVVPIERIPRRRGGKRDKAGHWSAIGQEGSSSESEEVNPVHPTHPPAAAARAGPGEEPVGEEPEREIEMVVQPGSQKPRAGRERASSLGYRSLDGSDAPFTTPATSTLPAPRDVEGQSRDLPRPESRSYVHLLDGAEGSNQQTDPEDRVAIQILPSDPEGPTTDQDTVDEEEKALEAPLLSDAGTPGDQDEDESSDSSDASESPQAPVARDERPDPPAEASPPGPSVAAAALSPPPVYQALLPDPPEAPAENGLLEVPMRRVEPGPNGGLVVTGPPPPLARNGDAMRFGAQSRCSQSHHSGLSGPSSEASGADAASAAQQRQNAAGVSGSSTSGTTGTLGTTTSGTTTTSSATTGISEPLPPANAQSAPQDQQPASQAQETSPSPSPAGSKKSDKDTKDESAHASPESPPFAASEPATIEKKTSDKKEPGAAKATEVQHKREIQQQQEG